MYTLESQQLTYEIFQTRRNLPPPSFKPNGKDTEYLCQKLGSPKTYTASDQQPEIWCHILLLLVAWLKTRYKFQGGLWLPPGEEIVAQKMGMLLWDATDSIADVCWVAKTKDVRVKFWEIRLHRSHPRILNCTRLAEWGPKELDMNYEMNHVESRNKIEVETNVISLRCTRHQVKPIVGCGAREERSDDDGCATEIQRSWDQRLDGFGACQHKETYEFSGRDGFGCMYEGDAKNLSSNVSVNGRARAVKGCSIKQSRGAHRNCMRYEIGEVCNAGRWKGCVRFCACQEDSILEGCPRGEFCECDYIWQDELNLMHTLASHVLTYSLELGSHRPSGRRIFKSRM
ncbi:hypothetical protein FB451DRAFT_1182391 [Mycena latifolia]|nr:hypothetical protein FB451DRAFT_1182391 [Mycena latifolia]